MNGKRVLTAALMVLATFAGATALMQYATTHKSPTAPAPGQSVPAQSVPAQSAPAQPTPDRLASGQSQDARSAPKPAQTPPPASKTAKTPHAAADRPIPTPGPSFSVIRIDSGKSSLFAGRAQPGETVIVEVGEQRIAAVTADSNGHWSASAPLDIEPGEHRLSVRAEYPKPNTAPGQTARLVVAENGRIRVDFNPPEKPASTRIAAKPVAEPASPGTTATPGKTGPAPNENPQAGTAATPATGTTPTARSPIANAPEKPAVSPQNDSTAGPGDGPDDGAGEPSESLLEEATRLADAASKTFSREIGNADADNTGPANPPGATPAPAPPVVKSVRLEETLSGGSRLTLSGESAPDAKLGLIIAGRRVAQTTADSKGNWNITQSLVTGDRPFDARIAVLDANGGERVASTVKLAREPSGQIAIVKQPATTTPAAPATPQAPKLQTADAGDATQSTGGTDNSTPSTTATTRQGTRQGTRPVLAARSKATARTRRARRARQARRVRQARRMRQRRTRTRAGQHTRRITQRHSPARARYRRTQTASVTPRGDAVGVLRLNGATAPRRVVGFRPHRNRPRGLSRTRHLRTPVLRRPRTRRTRRRHPQRPVSYYVRRPETQ